MIGTAVAVTARLTTPGGDGIAAGRITLEINGVLARATRTDAAGQVDLSISSDNLKTAATLEIRVSYAGDSTHGPSAAVTTIVVRPARIEVVTVPAVAGMAISFGVQEALTDDQGVAHFEVGALGRQVMTPHFDLPEASGIRLGFVRWEDDVFDAVRTIDIAGDARFMSLDRRFEQFVVDRYRRLTAHRA